MVVQRKKRNHHHMSPTWKKMPKIKGKLNKKRKNQKELLVCVAHVLLCCVETTSTAICVVTPLFVLSVQKLSSLICTKFETPTKKKHKRNPIEVHEINIEVQRNEPQQFLQGARDCLCCVFPLGPASLRPI